MHFFLLIFLMNEAILGKKIFTLLIFTFSIFTLWKCQGKARQPLAHYYHNSNFPNFYRWLDTIIHITPPQNDIDTIILLNFSASFLTFLYIPRMSFKMICRRIEKKYFFPNFHFKSKITFLVLYELKKFLHVHFLYCSNLNC